MQVSAVLNVSHLSCDKNVLFHVEGDGSILDEEEVIHPASSSSMTHAIAGARYGHILGF